MTTISKLGLGLSLSVALSAPAFAHHSSAAFNTQQRMTIQGPITKYDFKNPHVYFTVQVKNADGTTVLREVEAGAPSVLNPLGFTKESVKVGEVVSVIGNPARNPADLTFLGMELHKADGTYLPLNISSRSIYQVKNETATSIAGTWFPAGFGGIGRGWQQTPAARGATPRGSSQKDCIPVGMPTLMFYPVANVIKVEKDRVIIDVDWMDTVRTVWLDGRKHPAATETSLHGHSTGRWEGETLVIETTNFTAHVMGNGMNLASSTQKKLTERISLNADKKSLTISGTVEDPVYLAAPGAFSGTWSYRPGMPQSNEKCDLATALKFTLQPEAPAAAPRGGGAAAPRGGGRGQQ
jgi:hypothetical protein